MSLFLVVAFLINASTGCWCYVPGNRVAPTVARPPAYSSTNTIRVKVPKNHVQFPDIPFINVTAEVHAHGFCKLPWDLKEFNQRLTYDPETKYNASGLISSKGYPVQDYKILTKDGFILGTQRIPHGKNNSHIKGPRPVVLVQHGLFGSATNWLSNLANESLGFILADAGFDVWLGNARGNTYSKNHQHLKKWQKEFWYWSWDEMAKYDLPAVIDFILNTTGVKQISYIGHSQGTTSAFAAFSTNKDLQSKVNLFVALAPVANVSHMTSAVKPLLHPDIYIPLTDTLEEFRLYDFLPNGLFFDLAANTICDHDPTVIICQSVILLLGGYSCEHMNTTRLPVYISNTPAGTSIWDVEHWAQITSSETFSMFDFGSKGNIDHYNQTTPPVYNVQDIDIPIATFSGGKDVLADPTDVAQLLPQLKNLVFKKEIPSYGHLDFIWATDAANYVYSDVVKLLKDKII